MSLSQNVPIPGTMPGLTLRAWAWVTPTGSTGLQTVTKGSNVASVNKTAGGTFTVTFSTALPDVNYCAQLFPLIENRIGTGSLPNGSFMNTITTGGCVFITYQGQTVVDPAYPFLVAFYG